MREIIRWCRIVPGAAQAPARAGSTRAGSAGAAGSSAPQPGKAPPCRFSRSLGLPRRSEPEAVGAREAFFQHSSARGCEPSLAAGSDSFSARSPSYPGKADHHLQHGRSVRGTGENPALPPVAPPAPTAPEPCGTAGLLGRKLICSRSNTARPGPPRARRPAQAAALRRAAASRGQTRSPLPRDKGWLRPRCPEWARGSRRG